MAAHHRGEGQPLSTIFTTISPGICSPPHPICVASRPIQHSDDETSAEKLPNYGAVTMLLPGSNQAQDQVCTEISTMGREWERNGMGIWLPTNVLHRGRKPGGVLDRNNYLFEVHSNGTFMAAKDGNEGHNCRNVKAFRITLQQLLEIKSRQVHNVKGGGHTQSSNPYLIVAGR